ncbi:uncharacterized protein [Amphiura filiformis]|uniref:uncharacterized protein n=1 Tax=Amphiura filiformis TaxID=82378 RepID=UPI003B2132C1
MLVTPTGSTAPSIKYSAEFLLGLQNCSNVIGCPLSEETCLFIQANKVHNSKCNIHPNKKSKKRTRRGTKAGKRRKYSKASSSNNSTKFCCINTRSVGSKITEFVDFVIEGNYHLVAITETWIKPEDTSVIGNITPPGYSLKHAPRIGKKRGGGVALLYKTGLNIDFYDTGLEFKSFELLCVDITSEKSSISLVVLYRPQCKSTGCSFGIFIEEFSDLIDHFLLRPLPLVITGDFNIHVNVPDDVDAKLFLNVLSATGLEQHVTFPTHIHGNTLDLLITRISDPPVFSNLHGVDGLSDHYVVKCNLFLKKPSAITKSITARKLNGIDIDSLCDDIATIDLSTNSSNLSSKTQKYDFELSALLNKHAPAKTRTVTIRPNTSWYNDEIHAEKQKRRELEKKWRKSRLVIDHQLYKQQKQKVISLLKKAKANYYNDLCVAHANDQKQLFSIVNKLLHHKQEAPLPDCDSDKNLANKFCNFFTEKIKKIRNGFQIADDLSCNEPVAPLHHLTNFAPASEEEIQDILFKSPTKSCELDPVPTSLLKNVPVLLFR